MVGLLAVVPLVGCPLPEKEQVQCGALSIRETFHVPTTSPQEQDLPGGERCTSLVACEGTRFALSLEPDGRCTIQVDFSSPEQGTVIPGGQCETRRSRIGGETRDVGTALGGTVTLRDGRLDADIDWEVVIHHAGIVRVGATQHWTIRDTGNEPGPGQETPVSECREPEPPPGPEDFSAVVGCGPADFVVRTGESDERVVRFGGTLGAQYSPRCLTIAPGQTVAFEGPFSTYQLSPGLPESISSGAPFSPIDNVLFNSRATVTFPRTGDFLYSNRPNAAQGMKGLIRVR